MNRLNLRFYVAYINSHISCGKCTVVREPMRFIPVLLQQEGCSLSVRSRYRTLDHA